MAVVTYDDVRVVEPVAVVDAPDLKITEYIGNVASVTPEISACVCEVKKATSEAPQTPAFDEYVLVLEGSVRLEHAKGTTVVTAGQGAVLKAGTRVKWVWPGPCKYVPICLPGFTPTNCGREDDGGLHAKTSAAMDYLHELHAKAKHPWLYHCAQKALWDKAKRDGAVYYPPTYGQDGFTHATADPAKLLGVLNWFYKPTQGDWVCLRMSAKSLSAAGVETKFEAVAPVGDIPALPDAASGGELFPHLHGGIPPAAVLEEYAIVRRGDGSFASCPGVTDVASTPFAAAKKAAVAAAAVAALLVLARRR